MTKQPAKAAKTKTKKRVKDCHALMDLCSNIAFEGVIDGVEGLYIMILVPGYDPEEDVRVVVDLGSFDVVWSEKWKREKNWAVSNYRPYTEAVVTVDTL